MNYLQLLQKGLRFVVKSALEEVADQHAQNINLYITFKTQFPAVSIPEELVIKYPTNMTIVLQHEFWNLKVTETMFSVDLMFNGILQTLVIPFNAIYRFEDPDEPFSLDFIVDATQADYLRVHENLSAKKIDEKTDNILSLSDFRKNKKDSPTE